MTQVLNPLKIGKHISRYPIIQAAMAVGERSAKLASAVALSGGVGVIASLGLGLDSPYFDRRKRGSFFTANRLALIDELAEALSISPGGVIGVNILVATKDYSVLAKTAAASGANRQPIERIMSVAELMNELTQPKNSKRSEITMTH